MAHGCSELEHLRVVRACGHQLTRLSQHEACFVILFHQLIARHHGGETKSRAQKYLMLDDLAPIDSSPVTVSSFNMARLIDFLPC